jgi:flagellar biosynthesis protein FlhG
MMSMLATRAAGSSQADALLGRRTGGVSRELRRDDSDHAVPTLLCASGRGGSGTTLVSALLAVAAAGDGVRVLLIDADEHVGPLAMVLGVQARAGWQDLRGGRFAPVDVVTPVSTTLTLVAGGAPRVTSSATLTAPERRACMRRLGSLSHAFDLVVVDCGAQFDTVTSAITPHAGERLLAVAAGADPIGLAATYALCKAVSTRHGALPIDVLVNRHEGSEASRCFDAIDAGSRQFLGNALRLAGAVPADPTLDAALRSGMPFPDAAAGSPAAIAAHDVVMRLMAGTSSTRPGV